MTITESDGASCPCNETLVSFTGSTVTSDNSNLALSQQRLFFRFDSQLFVLSHGTKSLEFTELFHDFPIDRDGPHLNISFNILRDLWMHRAKINCELVRVVK
jgi:hypothetical protein